MSKTDWFKDGIVYQIFINRFAGYDESKDWNKPQFIGGDIRGIIEKLPYLEDLGVDTLWISPFYETSAYHGYHITDFFKVDPHFGSLDDLEELVEEVHDRGMKIISDFVLNHCSWKHPYFQEAQEDRNSDYCDWFYFKEWPDNYLCFLSYKELPKLNLEHEPARYHIIEAAKYWLDKGLDGYRLDHVVGPKHEFWNIFYKEIKRSFPEKVLIGEVGLYDVKFRELETIKVRNKYLHWLRGGSSDSLFKEYLGQLDGILDYRFFDFMRNYIANRKFYHFDKLLDWRLKLHYRKYPDDFLLPTFLDNHDWSRFLFECEGNKKKLKKAARIQFSLNQPPIIYYGTEVGMSQNKGIEKFEERGDLQARRPMEWKNQDEELLSFYKNIIQERKE